MDIYSNAVKYMGCREIICSGKRYKGMCDMSPRAHLLSPCQIFLLEGLFFTLSPISLNILCQRKYTNGQQPPLCPVVGPLWRRLKPAVWAKTHSDLLPKQASL